MESRAARTAGKRPPATPITSAKRRLAATMAGVTRKAKASSLSVCRFFVDVA